MTLKFNDSRTLALPSGLSVTLNTLVGDYNAKTDELNEVQREAYAAIERADAEFLKGFKAMAGRLHSAIAALELEDDEDREEIFGAVRDVLHDELWDFAHGNMEFDLVFDADGVSVEMWEASTC